jgi:hypothetical protein
MMISFGRVSATLLVLLCAGLAQGFAPAMIRPVAKVVSKAPISIIRPPTTTSSSRNTMHTPPLSMAAEQDPETTKTSNLPFWLDVGTKGGAVVVAMILFIVPIIIYGIVTSVFGYDEIEAGKWIGVGFTALSTFLWVGTYIFRVATKDMTYVSVSLLGVFANCLLAFVC